MPTWTSINFQDSSSPSMEHLILFHDHSMVILIAVTVSTIYLMSSSLMSNSFNRFTSESQELELFWTSVPTIMLIFIAMPSLSVLYTSEESSNPLLTIKTTGHQWYWSYEYPELKNVSFDSFLEKSEAPRLLSVSNQVMIPNKTPIRVLITSEDVIHSWTVPSLGVKADALPGRLNQVSFTANRVGTMTGQCSEICGANHSFMPISVSSMPIKEFIAGMKTI